MKTKIKISGKRIIIGIILFVLIPLVLSVSFQSCQKDEIVAGQEESYLKSASVPDYFTDIIDRINELVVDGIINKGIGNSLISKINNAAKSAEKGNTNAAVNQLNAFINEVNGLVNSRRLSEEQGMEMIVMAEDAVMLLHGSFVDPRDGNSYKVVRIGEQIWMAENLFATIYTDGTSIPNVTDNSAWAALTTGAYCWYNNDIGNKSTYGAIYNWYTVNTGKLCPADWHVPDNIEWMQLEMALGMTQEQADSSYWRGTDQGKQMKSTSGWYNDGNGNNSSGFSGLPGGMRYYNGGFVNIGSYGYWWVSGWYSNKFAWSRALCYINTKVAKAGYYKQQGFSVRCIKNN